MAGVGGRTVNEQENSTSGIWLCPLVRWYNSTCTLDLSFFLMARFIWLLLIFFKSKVNMIVKLYRFTFV